MKTRAGWVSNSSSSSFCILGFKAPKMSAAEMIEKLGIEYEDLQEMKQKLINDSSEPDYKGFEEFIVTGNYSSNTDKEAAYEEYEEYCKECLREMGYEGGPYHVYGGYDAMIGCNIDGDNIEQLGKSIEEVKKYAEIFDIPVEKIKVISEEYFD